MSNFYKKNTQCLKTRARTASLMLKQMLLMTLDPKLPFPEQTGLLSRLAGSSQLSILSNIASLLKWLWTPMSWATKYSHLLSRSSTRPVSLSKMKLGRRSQRSMTETMITRVFVVYQYSKTISRARMAHVALWVIFCAMIPLFQTRQWTISLPIVIMTKVEYWHLS